MVSIWAYKVSKAGKSYGKKIQFIVVRPVACFVMVFFA